MLRPPRYTFIAVLGLLACADSQEPAGPSRLAPYTEPAGNLTTQLVPNEYIVVLRDGETDVMGATSAATAAGGQVIARWDRALRGYAVRGGANTLNEVRRDPRVKFVEPNGVVTIGATQSPTPSWGLDRIDQVNLPLNNSYTYGNTGSGVHVYIIDTGIRGTHVEFTGRMGNGTDIITPGGTGADCNGHGTHVAGTAGGTSFGVAKGVTLHPVRVLDCFGNGTSATVISGINWVIANRVLPAVANMSLGGGFNSGINTATTNLVAAGVTTAVASGNDGANACNYSPASTPNAITVNASNKTDFRAPFSNWGTCTDIFAPGTQIVSAWYTSNTAAATLGGTSMASPHVAGAAALYHAANPGSTPAQVATALFANASLNKIQNVSGSPNRLLNVSFIGGGGPGNQPPVADFTITCTVSPRRCTVNAAPSTDDGGFGNLTFEWTQTSGRPSPKFGVTTNFGWFSPGTGVPNTFDVTLKATDSGGLSHSVTKVVSIP